MKSAMYRLVYKPLDNYLEYVWFEVHANSMLVAQLYAKRATPDGFYLYTVIPMDLA